MSFSWISRPNVGLSNEDSHPLLPTNGIDDDDEIELEMPQFASNGGRRRWTRWLRRPWAIALIFGVIVLLFLVASSGPKKPKPRRHPGRPAENFWNVSNAKVDALFARQSSTLEQAMARYSLRNNRPPPPMYDKWFEFAQQHSCLIDEYEQISRDFEPFYQLAKDDPAYFKKMVDKGTPQVQEDGRGLKTGVFAEHEFSWTDAQFTLYPADWARTFGRFASFIPDMPIIINGRDEPRVVFNYRLPDTHPKALHLSDETPFRHTPRPTASYFQDEMKCLVPMKSKGFTSLANDASGFMLFASSTDFTTDLYPILSMTKVTPCFADILVPSEFYYRDSWWSPSYGYANNISWDDKEEQLYWRGMTSGGWVWGENYHAFPRFRLIDIGRKHRDLMDVRLSGFHESLCGENCNSTKIKAEYEIAPVSSPREEVYKFKYLFDVDGNSFSGRYLGLLRSGSLVFKVFRAPRLARTCTYHPVQSTIFAEYFNDWLRPFEHYIPILPDLSDLVEKIEWAIAHDDEAHAIQQAGQVFAQRVLTDAQNDCYFSAVMLEWAQLYRIGVEGQHATPAPVDIEEDLATDQRRLETGVDGV
ncbi:glycosyl transferase family 90-domain-containing protein [Mycena galopus ATCC 62051]|nr:glycosyl transferase family 90-domain-containing protein [Mycena galopus ATCC 62051]